MQAESSVLRPSPRVPAAHQSLQSSPQKVLNAITLSSESGDRFQQKFSRCQKNKRLDPWLPDKPDKKIFPVFRNQVALPVKSRTRLEQFPLSVVRLIERNGRCSIHLLHL
jgi:hypothetical protein